MTRAINPEPQGDASQTLAVKKKKLVRKKKTKKKYLLLSRSLLKGVACLFKNTKKRNLLLRYGSCSEAWPAWSSAG